MLHADCVSFAYGAARVLDEVSIDIAAGARVGILGPNGSGKTTLLRLLAGALAPAGGRMRLDDADLATVPRRTLARRLAVVPQETELAFDYSVLEIVLMGRYPHLGPFQVEGPEDLAVAFEALDATGTREFVDRPFKTLSGGEKQRVVIASALAQLEGRAGAPAPGAHRPVPDPSFLLLDEPTASLDLHYQIQIAALLRRLHLERQISIVLSTHDLHFVRAVCTDVVLLSRGRVLARGPIAEVLTPALVAQLYDITPAEAAPVLAR